MWRRTEVPRERSLPLDQSPSGARNEHVGRRLPSAMGCGILYPVHVNRIAFSTTPPATKHTRESRSWHHRTQPLAREHKVSEKNTKEGHPTQRLTTVSNTVCRDIPSKIRPHSPIMMGCESVLGNIQKMRSVCPGQSLVSCDHLGDPPPPPPQALSLAALRLSAPGRYASLLTDV